ncbi:MAG: PEP-CTERM sorting domain-containing protein [Pirellulales bacterium]
MSVQANAIMRHRQRQQLAFALLALCLATVPAPAITIQLDYTYDTGFLAPGSQARASLDAAANFFSNILNDTFSTIQTPPKFVGSSGGMVVWQWTMNFGNPSNTNPVVLTDPTVNADQYRIFAGARNLSGNTLGIGGSGGYSWSSTPTGGFTSGEITQINQTTTNFENAVERRGETSGFARWGGTIAFDSAPPSPWHYNPTTMPSGGVTDFYSVAIHELAHALGFGERDDDPGNVTPWESFVSGTSFFGSNANAEYGGAVPLSGDLSHWASGASSVVYGTSISQEVAMDPELTTGTRKRFTELDAAAMKDIGWTVVPPPALFGDYNDNGIVDAADYVIWRKRLNQNVTIPNDMTPGMVTATDYTVWRTNFGDTPSGGTGSAVAGVPEPSGTALMLLGCATVRLAHRKRRREDGATDHPTGGTRRGLM